MKKSSIINLIKCFAEHNDNGFRSQAAEVANEFYAQGDTDLSDYIMSLIATNDIFIPQIMYEEHELNFCTMVSTDSPSILLPQAINEDVMGVVNAIGYNAGINRFLFSGAPGTGKTETVKQISRILERTLYSVNFDLLIDSKMGQTAKNIAEMFNEINRLLHPEKVIMLLDEIDSIAMSRIVSNDIREMGRATSALMKGLDSLNAKIALIATTNLKDQFDSALLRRFDSVVDFNRYSENDLFELSESLMDQFLKIFTFAKKDSRLLKKVLKESDSLPYPGDMSNLIKTSMAFSDKSKPYDYLRIMYKHITSRDPSVNELKIKGYSVREIEKLTGISKSTVSRESRQLQID